MEPARRKTTFVDGCYLGSSCKFRCLQTWVSCKFRCLQMWVISFSLNDDTISVLKHFINRRVSVDSSCQRRRRLNSVQLLESDNIGASVTESNARSAKHLDACSLSAAAVALCCFNYPSIRKWVWDLGSGSWLLQIPSFVCSKHDATPPLRAWHLPILRLYFRCVMVERSSIIKISPSIWAGDGSIWRHQVGRKTIGCLKKAHSYRQEESWRF